MKLLLDTHLLLWAASAPEKLSSEAKDCIGNPENTLFFSAASIWEISIKQGLARPDFDADPHLLRRGLLDNGYGEIAISSEHALAINSLPPLHKDPFDRVLIAQSLAEGITLLTADSVVAQYSGPIKKV